MQRAATPTRTFLAFPWSGRAWHALAFAALSVALNFLPLVILAMPWAYTVPVSLLGVLACAFIPLGVVVLIGPWLSVLRRACFREVLGVDIPKPPAARRPADRTRPSRTGLGRDTFWPALRDQLKSPRTWREAYYHLLAGPAVNSLGAFAGMLWLGALVCLPGLGFGWAAGLFGLRVFERPGVTTLEVWVALLCLGLLYLTPWVVVASVRQDTRVATDLLGPSREEKLARRVANLTESRAAVVDAADAERRRIERDLHDGAQQRLVSLAMNLGLAKATLPDLTEGARLALEEAHREAKEALGELRDLVRGLHPVVLEDRGLDAALSGIAARSPVPVRLTVRVSGRVAPAVEAIAYFIVSEALANTAKHARAAHAEVEVVRAGDMLRLTVTDDGVGGADARRGSGLTGLAQRAASVDGRFELSSPPGGPTRIEVRLPCEP